MKPIPFDNITALLLSVFDETMTNKDITLSKKLIILNETFFKVVGDKRMYLQKAIQNHPIWKRTDFWEVVILDSIKTEFSNQSAFFESANEKDAKTIWKNLIIGQLSTIGYKMVLVGISIIDMTKIVEKYGRLFKMSEEMIKEISVVFFLFFRFTLFIGFQTKGVMREIRHRLLKEVNNEHQPSPWSELFSSFPFGQPERFQQN